MKTYFGWNTFSCAVIFMTWLSSWLQTAPQLFYSHFKKKPFHFIHIFFILIYSCVFSGSCRSSKWIFYIVAENFEIFINGDNINVWINSDFVGTWFCYKWKIDGKIKQRMKRKKRLQEDRNANMPTWIKTKIQLHFHIFWKAENKVAFFSYFFASFILGFR